MELWTGVRALSRSDCGLWGCGGYQVQDIFRPVQSAPTMQLLITVSIYNISG